MHLCVQLCHSVYSCVQCVQLCHSVYSCVTVCTVVSQCVQLCHSVYSCVTVCTVFVYHTLSRYLGTVDLDIIIITYSLVLDQEDLLQLHTTLTEALTSVVHFLHTLESIGTFTSLSHPVVVAAVRVLGAWLAEESLVLSEEVYKLLPFLLKLCGRGSSMGRKAEGRKAGKEAVGREAVGREAGKEAEGRELENSEDVLKFLLPGLCHLTAEDKPRKVLLKADLQKTVLEYIQGLCSRRPLSRLGPAKQWFQCSGLE